MTITNLPEALQSSALAPLFLDIDKPDIKKTEDPDATIVRFKLKSLLPIDDDKALKFILIENQNTIHLIIPHVAHSKEMEFVARVGHVNKMVNVGRVYWDPEDGEIGIDWVILKSDENAESVQTIEYVMACVIQIYATESLYFLTKNLEMAEIPQATIKPIIEAAKKEFNEIFKPALDSVLSD